MIAKPFFFNILAGKLVKVLNECQPGDRASCDIAQTKGQGQSNNKVKVLPHPL